MSTFFSSSKRCLKFYEYSRLHVGGFPNKMVCGPTIIEPYEEIEGGNIKVPSGMKTILKHLQVREKAKIAHSRLYY